VKQLFIGCLVLVCLVGFAFADIDGPAEMGGLYDGAQPSQANNEGKFWKNTLNTYNMFRQTAAAFVADINAIVNVAEAIQKQINAIERMFLVIEDVAAQTDNLIKTVKDTTFWNNMSGPVDFVTKMEEEVFQKMDGLVVTTLVTFPQSADGAWAARHGIKSSTKDFKKLLDKQYRAFDSSMYSISWVSRYFDGIYQYDLKTLGEKKTYIEKNLLNGGKTDPVKLAEGNRDIRRQELMMTLLEHETLGSNINFWAEILKMKTEALAATNSQRYGLFIDLGGKFDE